MRNNPAQMSAVPAEVVNVLFLHAREYFTPDLAVHYSLMTAFDPAQTKPFVVSNSQAKDIERHQQANAANPRLVSYSLPLGVPLAAGSESSLRGLAVSLLSCIAVLPRLLLLVRRNKIAIIHSTDRPRDIFLATLLAKAAHLPNIIHLHTNADAYHNRVVQWGFRRATAFLAVSNFIRQEGLDMGLRDNTLHMVPNATDCSHFDPRPLSEKRSVLRQELRAQFGLPEDAFVVGIIARVIEWKGQKELIEAVASLIPRCPTLYLLIVGGNSDPKTFTEYEAQLAARIQELNVQDHVAFAGRFQDVRPILAALDLFALPSYEEPFGLAITEAMAMELPVIACSSGGVPEIIEDRRTGCLVEPRSASSLADAIQFLFEHPEEAQQMGRAARRRIVETFAAEDVASRVSDIYQAVLARRGSSAP